MVLVLDLITALIKGSSYYSLLGMLCNVFEIAGNELAYRSIFFSFDC